MIVWGGQGENFDDLNTGGQYIPGTTRGPNPSRCALGSRVSHGGVDRK